MAALMVYALCAVTSVLCAALLFRAHGRTGGTITRGAAACFALLAIENAVLFADRVIYPGVDLSLLRNALGLIGPAVFVAALTGDDA